MVNESEHSSKRILVDTQVERVVATNALQSRVGITLCLNDFEFINRVSMDTEGVSLIELGSTDARRAYKIARAAVCHLVETDMTAAVINGNVVADRHDATAEELTMISKTSIANILPDEDTTEFDFTVAVYPSTLDVHILKMDPGSSTPIVEMRVTPPDLAA